MHVKTDHVPKTAKHYLTPGEKYKVVKDYGNDKHYMIDIGLMTPIFINIQSCLHLNGYPWTVTYETN